MTQTKSPLLAQTVKVLIGACGLAQAVGAHLQAKWCRSSSQSAEGVSQEEFSVLKAMVKKIHTELEALKEKK